MMMATLHEQVIIRDGPGPEDAKDSRNAFGVKSWQLYKAIFL